MISYKLVSASVVYINSSSIKIHRIYEIMQKNHLPLLFQTSWAQYQIGAGYRQIEL
jgi:hypothetical protein